MYFLHASFFLCVSLLDALKGRKNNKIVLSKMSRTTHKKWKMYSGFRFLKFSYHTFIG